MKNKLLAVLAMTSLCAFNFQLSTAHAQVTAFTYQGRLNNDGSPANGSYDLTFTLFATHSSGGVIAGPVTNNANAVTNGLFTTTIDFGAGIFTGTNYWLQLAVRPSGVGTFATLTPRQQLTPTPYALSLVSPQVNALCPPGSVMAYMGVTPPPGWLLCDGSVVSRNQYTALFAVISTSSGAGDGSTTFNLPDLRGVFLRGVNGSRSDALADPGDSRTNIFTGGNTGNAVGSYQQDQFRAHSHNDWWNFSVAAGSPPTVQIPELYSGGSGSINNPTDSQGGTETRPKNVYVNYIIKY